MHPVNAQKNHVVSFLVLDYKKPQEAGRCLQSIRSLVKFPHEIIYQDNGSGDSYSDSFLSDGLCDVLIKKRRGMGGGFGQSDLFRYCDTQYAVFVQSDQYLRYELTSDHLDQFIRLLQKGYHCVDLNGDQSNREVWTDRAHFIDVPFFNSLGPFPNGGPGLFHHLPWNEKYLQDTFQNKNYKIAHLKPAIFADNGVFTVRENADGSVLRMRTDTKQLHWEVLPKVPYVFPDLTAEEWADSIAGKFVNGTVPINYKAHSFNCWGNI